MNSLNLKRLASLIFLLSIGCGERERAGDDDAASARDSPHATRSSSRPSRDGAVSSREGFESALRAARELPTPEERASALADLARQWLERNPARFERVLREISPDSGELPGLVGEYLLSLLAHDPEDAIRWVDSLEDPALHELALGQLAAMMPGERLGEAATSMLNAGRLAAHGFDPASTQLLQRWSAEDPAAAGAWLARMPTGESQHAGLQAVAGHLLMTGHVTPAAWLQSLPATSLRPVALDSMAATLATYPDPIRESLLGPPDSTLRALLQQSLAARLPPPPAPEPDPAEIPHE